MLMIPSKRCRSLIDDPLRPSKRRRLDMAGNKEIVELPNPLKRKREMCDEYDGSPAKMVELECDFECEREDVVCVPNRYGLVEQMCASRTFEDSGIKLGYENKRQSIEVDANFLSQMLSSTAPREDEMRSEHDGAHKQNASLTRDSMDNMVIKPQSATASAVTRFLNDPKKESLRREFFTREHANFVKGFESQAKQYRWLPTWQRRALHYNNLLTRLHAAAMFQTHALTDEEREQKLPAIELCPQASKWTERLVRFGNALHQHASLQDLEELYAKVRDDFDFVKKTVKTIKQDQASEAFKYESPMALIMGWNKICLQIRRGKFDEESLRQVSADAIILLNSLDGMEHFYPKDSGGRTMFKSDIPGFPNEDPEQFWQPEEEPKPKSEPKEDDWTKRGPGYEPKPHPPGSAWWKYVPPSHDSTEYISSEKWWKNYKTNEGGKKKPKETPRTNPKPKRHAKELPLKRISNLVRGRSTVSSKEAHEWLRTYPNVFRDIAQMTTIPYPPSSNCGNRTCRNAVAARSYPMQACQCDILQTMNHLWAHMSDKEMKKKVQQAWHPNRPVWNLAPLALKDDLMGAVGEVASIFNSLFSDGTEARGME